MGVKEGSGGEGPTLPPKFIGSFLGRGSLKNASASGVCARKIQCSPCTSKGQRSEFSEGAKAETRLLTLMPLLTFSVHPSIAFWCHPQSCTMVRTVSERRRLSAISTRCFASPPLQVHSPPSLCAIPARDSRFPDQTAPDPPACPSSRETIRKEAGGRAARAESAAMTVGGAEERGSSNVMRRTRLCKHGGNGNYWLVNDLRGKHLQSARRSSRPQVPACHGRRGRLPSLPPTPTLTKSFLTRPDERARSP